MQNGFAWSRTISTSATVLMISRCRVTRPATTATRYRSGQPVNHTCCVRVIRCHQRLSSCVSLPQGFLFLQVTNHIPLHLLQSSCSRFSRATSRTASRTRCGSAVHSPAARLPVQIWQTGHAQPGNIPDSLLCFAVRQVRFVSATLRTISSARRSVSRRMASQPAAVPVPLP